jgi:hypothetical protein
MKRLLHAMPIAGLFAAALAASGQTPVITSIGDGQLTFTNISSNLEYRLQWTGNPTGTPQDVFNAVEYITPTGAAGMTIDVPLSFRVATTNRLSNGIVRASEQIFNLPMGTNDIATFEWSETAGGPWSTNWGVNYEMTSTGAVMTVPTPHFYRLSFINCPSNWPAVACTNWLDATAPGANRTNDFCEVLCNFNYTKPCMKIRSGQTVTFRGINGASLLTIPLSTACQDWPAMTNTSSGSSVAFTFEKPGFYNYHAAPFYGTTNGEGAAGNIWVIP